MEEYEELTYEGTPETSEDISRRPSRRRLIVKRTPKIPERAYGAKSITLGGSPITLKEISKGEVRLFNQDFETLLEAVSFDAKGQMIKNLLIKNRWVLFNATRATMYTAKKSYEGRNTTGDGIMLDWVRAMDVLGTTDWPITISATGSVNFWDSTGTPGTAMTLNDHSGVVVLGEVNEATEPKTDLISWKKGGKDYGAHTLAWDFNKYKVLPEPQPLVYIPGETVFATLNAVATGTEDIIPLALKITTRVIDGTAGSLE